MTGSNFKFFDRHDETLENMLKKYYDRAERLHEYYDKLRYDDEDFDYDFYYKMKDNQRFLAKLIWETAFYHFGRDWNIANDFCKRKGVDY